jgi:ATP-dependent DNA helicase RecQ
MRNKIKSVLKTNFEFSEFREGQENVILTLLEGRSSLAVFPTGGGKSLCFQLPALIFEGLTLVISPLIALMKDQVEALLAKGILASRLDSTRTAVESKQVYEDMLSGRLKLLYIAPERLTNEFFLSRLKRTKVSLLVIDEAHCISGWGHNFRPEYLRLADMATKLNLHPVLTLTATATPDVVKDIQKAFSIKPTDCVQTSFHRKNLSIFITPVEDSDRLDLLTKKLQKFRRFPAIVYVTFQKTAEYVASHLTQSGLIASAYHAGLRDDVRARVQEDFMSDKIDVIVATIAFGMGIDKGDIRAVYHFNLPKTLENYQQEIGRAGRDGKLSHCELFSCCDDLIPLQNFTFGDTPTPKALEQLIQSLLNQPTTSQVNTFDISHYELSREFDIRPLVLETILTYLELDGILEPLGPYYAGYDVAFTRSKSKILAKHTPERQVFLKSLFESGQMGSKWLKLILNECVVTLNQPRERIVSALTWLEEQGDIELKVSGLRHRYRLLDTTQKHNILKIVERMNKLFSEREFRDFERLNQVVAYAQDGKCLTRHLLHYFGEESHSNCGHCCSCLEENKQPRIIPVTSKPKISDYHLRKIRELIDENHVALNSSRQLTRFFCGITSPATSRDKLTKHLAFGMLEQVPFLNVMAEAEKYFANS